MVLRKPKKNPKVSSRSEVGLRGSGPYQLMGFGIYSLYRKFQPGFREKRIRLFLEKLKPGSDTRILDVGGHAYDWEGVPVDSRITLLNVAYPTGAQNSSRFTSLIGDGRKMDFEEGAFEIAYSNSVIEHVGSFEDQKRFASEARRVGKRIFVQTPNRWFPVEPHFGALFVHFLPWTLAKVLLRFLSFRGLFRSGDNVDLKHLANELRLLSFREMRELFPDCEIYRERCLGLTKSFIAIR